MPASWGDFSTAGDATVGTRGETQFGLGFEGGSGDRGRHLTRMFDWNDEQQQVSLPISPSVIILDLALLLLARLDLLRLCDSSVSSCPTCSNSRF